MAAAPHFLQDPSCFMRITALSLSSLMTVPVSGIEGFMI
jgi:hypothetical protein